MSIRDFEKYRHSLSYTLPTPEEVKKKPYGVVDKGVYGKHFKELNKINKLLRFNSQQFI